MAKYEIKNKVALSYFDKIENRVIKLNSFIKNVIEISRNARTDVKVDFFSLKELLHEVVENNDYLEGMTSMTIKLSIDFEEDIRLDKSRLEIVLNNLISNAIKYRKKQVNNPYINITAQKSANALNISVADNGSGIDALHKERIFEMFYRGSESSEGSGLGLYIVKATLEKLDGTIEMDSEVDKGTTFNLSIPFNR